MLVDGRRQGGCAVRQVLFVYGPFKDLSDKVHALLNAAAKRLFAALRSRGGEPAAGAALPAAMPLPLPLPGERIRSHSNDGEIRRVTGVC